AELGFYDMRWVPSGRASSELIAVRLRIRHHDDLGNALPLVRGGQVELLVEGEGHVHRGMRAPTTGIGLKTDLLATKTTPQTITEFLVALSVRLVHRTKSIAPSEDVLGPSKTFARQHCREHTTTGCLPGLQALGQRTIDNALTISSRIAQGDTEGVHHLLDAQSQQFSSRSRGAKDAHGRRTMPAPIHGGSERHPAGNVQPQGDGNDTITPRSTTSLFGHCQAR